MRVKLLPDTPSGLKQMFPVLSVLKHSILEGFLHIQKYKEDYNGPISMHHPVLMNNQLMANLISFLVPTIPPPPKSQLDV